MSLGQRPPAQHVSALKMPAKCLGRIYGPDEPSDRSGDAQEHKRDMILLEFMADREKLKVQ